MRPLLLLLSVTCIAGCGDERWAPEAPTPPELPEVWVKVSLDTAGGTRVVHGILRATRSQRQVGLMYRKKRLADDEAMLFLMDNDADHSFWMQNTFIPLDMLFIDREGLVVGMVENVTPRTTQGRSVGSPSRFVLELDAGWCKRHGLVAGAQTRFDFGPRP